MTPEEQARVDIDARLVAADWEIRDVSGHEASFSSAVAVREVVTGAGRADYVFFLDGKAAGIIEAKRAGFSPVGVAERAGACAAAKDWIPRQLAVTAPALIWNQRFLD